MDICSIRKDFPSISSKNDQNIPIIYFDNAATALKPKCVLDSSFDVYLNAYGNPNRGTHTMGVRASKIMDETRECVKEFIGARDKKNIIFTKNATESLNIITFSYALKNLSKGDEILIGIDSHHANFVPWKVICEKKGIKLNYFYVNSDGEILFDDFMKKLDRSPKLVSFTPVTNTFGVIHDYKKIIKLCKDINAKVVVDASQSMTHIKFNVYEDDIDFFVFSGHKLMAPQGVGVLYINDENMNFIDPFLYGGDMIDYVFEDEVTFKNYFEKFEGGTQNVSSIAGLNKAIEYINRLGLENIVEYEKNLTKYFVDKSRDIEDLILYGPKNIENRTCVFSFNVKNIHPHDVSTILDSYGIAVRSGHHCAQPFMRKLGLNSTTRASLYFYNTKEEIDYFFEKIHDVKRILKF